MRVFSLSLTPLSYSDPTTALRIVRYGVYSTSRPLSVTQRLARKAAPGTTGMLHVELLVHYPKVTCIHT
jgi:hypothetical protein